MSRDEGKEVGAAQMDSVTSVPQEGGVPAANETQIHTCTYCGSQKTDEPLVQCMLCLQNFCINHLAPTNHHCFGALGKPPT